MGCFFVLVDFNHRVHDWTDERTFHFLHTRREGHPTMAKAATASAKKAKAPTKSEILNNIASATDLSRKEVSAVLDALAGEIKKAVSGRGPGVFAIPGLVKIERKAVPARAAQKNVPNPFKPGELMDRPAKPAYKKIKVRALKNLKSMV